ncbi:MGH1-like glycoside hydrolase domain-containing protein [Paenibacillus sp. Root444D2]|uniref:MGH1-like glycoside hydrolase domain-containing protein n=1 Tax=Paenibacillus sp. Root444D2 TaxID=1736538 RepID=UPI00070DC606|nr:trehalase family glycosidase [Paenibacillus sp. Root444D2]KQX55290.1 alpha,alpha-trehalase [Paenibacillus sp. Root444D2]
MPTTNHTQPEQWTRGLFFNKKAYADTQLLTFEEARSFLPAPIFESRPDYIECYWRTWEIAYRNTFVPTKESGFVSNFIDAAFNDKIFLWDTAFITMFCNLAHPYIPGIRSLDNFYCKQLDDGEIAREYVTNSGIEFYKWVNAERKPLHSFFHNHYKHRGLAQINDLDFDVMYKPDLGRTVENPPYFRLDNLNHPIVSWAELESFKHTGDRERLELVWEPLVRYYDALCYHLYNHYGLFVTDWASMDNSPRNQYLGSGVDISCEMVLVARSLIEIGGILIDKKLEEGSKEAAKDLASQIARLEKDAGTFTTAINTFMWDAETGFYYDVKNDGQRAPVKTIAAYWALLAEVADESQAAKLAEWLNDPNTFNRVHRVPVCAADEPGYDPQGGYWRGSVWAPTNTMVIRGLEKYGYLDLAREIALNHLNNVVQVYKDTGSIWENYPPDSIDSGNADKKDFVGWSGIASTLYLLEHAIGLKGDASRNELTWRLQSGMGTIGCNRYWFAGKTIDLIAIEQTDGSYILTVTSDAPVKLNVLYGVIENKTEVNGTIQIRIKS